MTEKEKKAIEMLDKFITEHKFYNIKQSDNLEDNIKIILNFIEKLQKENEKLREIKNCVVPVSVIKKWIKDREEKIEKMHPASDCVLIDDYETQIDILKKLLEDEIYDGE